MIIPTIQCLPGEELVEGKCVFEDSKSNTNYGPKDIHFENNFIWTDDSNDAIFKYNTTGVSNIYEETITFSGDVYFGGTQNTGNGTLTNTGIDLSSFSTEIPTTTMIDGLIYYTGLQVAKDLEMLDIIE